MRDETRSQPPDIAKVRRLRETLDRWLLRTPSIRCTNIESLLGDAVEIWGKLEFLQQTGTFKPRGALSTVLSLNANQRAAGITAVSAGNHAIAAAFAARAIGTTAKVVMLKSSNPARVSACAAYGAEVVMSDNVHQAFALVEEIQREEGRFFVHPFEGEHVATGTGTVGLEICEQVDDIDVIICPIGGGGLCAGVASVVKQLQPNCQVIGVEPEGALSMHHSFASGEAVSIESVDTIADSLGAPFAMPYTFALCRDNIDRLVKVSDVELKQAMGVLFQQMKMAVEPACAASTAALMGPLRGDLAGKKVVLVFCGSNIDAATYLRYAELN